MTRTALDPLAGWTKTFTEELRLRNVDQKHINIALDSIREQLTESGELPGDALGDPREYAASLGLPSHDRSYGRSSTFLAIALAVASLLVFGIAVNHWLVAGATPTVIGWTLMGAVILLGASIWASVEIARNVVEAAIRERFSGDNARLWDRWAPIAIVTPWAFPAFATIIVLISALRS